MRVLIVLSLSVCFFAACQKITDRPSETHEVSAYVLENLEFFLTPDDRPDSTIQRLDTLTFINTATTNLPDTTFYLYAAMEDTISLVTTIPQDGPLEFVDSISFRRQTIHTLADGTFIYGQLADSIRFTRIPDTVAQLQQRVQIATTVSPTPRTKYQLTGEYWHVRYSVSFRAQAVQPESDERIPLEGKVHYSTVAVSAFDGQTPIPRATTLIASDLD